LTDDTLELIYDSQSVRLLIEMTAPRSKTEWCLEPAVEWDNLVLIIIMTRKRSN